MNIKGLIIVLVLTGCMVAPNPPAAKEGEVLEFVCEADGVLTERHVGVQKVWRYGDEGDVWTIAYVDGDGRARYYRQQPGETCAVEGPGNGH